MPRCFLIDGSYLAHRAFHAPFRNLTSPQGDSTKVPYIICKQIIKLHEDLHPDYWCVFFDGPRRLLHRRRIDCRYKEDRGEPDPDFASQMKLTKRLLTLFGIKVIAMEGWEADDGVATLVDLCVAKKTSVVIVSRDKDLMCLVSDPSVRLLDPFDGKWYDEKAVKARYGVPPSLMPDYLALVGDRGDNIKGVEGWGPKTAVKALTGYNGGIDVLLAKMPTSKADHNLLLSHRRGELKKARDLVRLDRNVPLECKLSDLIAKQPDLVAAKPLLKKLGFRSLDR